jgi:uncharacterized protein (DUF1330 family)
MPAYLLGIIKSVNDRRAMEEYWSRAGDTVAGFGVKPLAAYTPFKMLEGKGPVEAVAAFEFPDMETAKRWYESAAYQAAKKSREGAADIDLILVDGGVVPDPEQRMPHIKGNVKNP